MLPIDAQKEETEEDQDEEEGRRLLISSKPAGKGRKGWDVEGEKGCKGGKDGKGGKGKTDKGKDARNDKDGMGGKDSKGGKGGQYGKGANAAPRPSAGIAGQLPARRVQSVRGHERTLAEEDESIDSGDIAETNLTQDEWISAKAQALHGTDGAYMKIPSGRAWLPHKNIKPSVPADQECIRDALKSIVRVRIVDNLGNMPCLSMWSSSENAASSNGDRQAPLEERGSFGDDANANDVEPGGTAQRWTSNNAKGNKGGNQRLKGGKASGGKAKGKGAEEEAWSKGGDKGVAEEPRAKGKGKGDADKGVVKLLTAEELAREHGKTNRQALLASRGFAVVDDATAASLNEVVGVVPVGNYRWSQE